MLPLVSVARVGLVALSLAVAAGTVAAQPADAKLDKALREVQDTGSSRVIIRATTKEARAAVRRALKADGVVISAEHPSVNGITASVRNASLKKLARLADIESMHLDAEMSPTGVTPGLDLTPAGSSRSLRETLGLTADSPDGRGIGIALIDSGVVALHAFKYRIGHFFDFRDGRASHEEPVDGYGHGTHIAGLIAGKHTDGEEYNGVAPGAEIIGFRVLDEQGKGRTSDVIRAIEYAVANRVKYNIRIINLSIGHPILTKAANDPLVQAVEYATRNGIVVVISAGNIGANPQTGEVGYAGITSPANAPSAITVGALDTKATISRADDAVTMYSSRGPTWFDAFAKPDVVAPGHALMSSSHGTTHLYNTYPTLRSLGVVNSRNKFMTLSGTSMSAGVVTGVVALMLDANNRTHPNGTPLSPNAVKAMLQFSALPLPGVDALTQGAGAINAEGAVRLAAAANGSAAPNAAWADETMAHQSVIGGESWQWSSSILWGENIVWGETVFANQPAWANNIVWGEDTFNGVQWATNIVWGENVVWSMADDNIVWGMNIVWGEGLLHGLMDDNIVWSMVSSADNIVWGELSDDNIVWSMDDDNIVWSFFDDNIVWGMDGIVWSDEHGDHGHTHTLGSR